MWNSRQIERKLEDRLKKDLGPDVGAKYLGRYQHIRQKLVEEVFGQIAATEPNLTDHSGDHVGNVLDNADKLLGDEIDDLNSFEIYILCSAILFHDVGNVYGREKHNRRISNVYNALWNETSKNRREASLIVKIGEAHSGKSSDGSSDTLRELTDSHYEGERIRVQELAAILRLADELAEGPQRTSYFMQDEGLYRKDSQIFHKYANVTNVHIDKNGERIVLDYQIEVEIIDDELRVEQEFKFPEFFEFVLKRLNKLNVERKYAKHYCHFLEKFKKVEFSITFADKNLMEVHYLGPLRLDDLVLPDEASDDIQDRFHELNSSSLSELLLGRLAQGETDD